MATDPRPDLETDSDTWAKLLSAAYTLDEPDMDGAYGALLGIRCLGAQIARNGAGWAIQRGEIPEDEYQAIRAKYLLPVKDRITGLLGRLA